MSKKAFAFKSSNQVRVPHFCTKPVHDPCICREKNKAGILKKNEKAEHDFNDYLNDRKDCEICSGNIDFEDESCQHCNHSWIHDTDKRIACPKCGEDMTYCDIESEQKTIKADYFCLCCGFNIKHKMENETCSQ